MLHHLYILPILLLPFVQCISNDENAQQEKKLPNVLNAEHYTIDIKTIWDDNLKPISFEGIVTILVVTKEELDEIIINSRALELSNISVSHNEEEIYFNHTEAKKQYDGYIIRLTKIIPPNQECKISINFKGNISTGLTGFYMNKYIENGEKMYVPNFTILNRIKNIFHFKFYFRYLATTQFQPLFTRRVFPCFDEPHFKSTFKLTITRPASLTPTISNMPIENSENLDDDQIKDIFHTTPKMSPYLLYFGLTRYQSSSNDSPIKIWARSRLIKNADYAINISKKSVDFMENYTGIEYFQQFDSVVMKIDSIAIPHYKYGAMENWGAITYRFIYFSYFI